MKENYNIKPIPWDLILKILKETASEGEKDHFKTWIEIDDRHRRLWNELQQAWDDICEFNSESNPDTSRAWQQLVEKTKKQYQKPARVIPIHWQVAAACIFVLIGVAIGVRFKTSIVSPTTYTQYETQYGKSFITLPDGTHVWLNARTTLKLSSQFNKKERQVEVHGEAFFDVTHNSDAPFLVDMKDMQVKVHGTRFNVLAYDNKPEASISLLEGSVSLAAAGCPDTTLQPGYTAIYDRGGMQITLNPSDALVTLWASNELRIEDKSLAETARLLESWYHVKIEVAPALKSSQYYTFTVRHESPAELLAAMQKIGKFQYKIDEQKVMIY